MKRLFQFLSGWPLPLLHIVGTALGWLAFLLSPTYRRRFVANAAQAGYGFAQVRGAVAQAGRLLAETPRLWFGVTPRVLWDGAEAIEAVRAQGRGIVFLTPHLGCFEVTAQAYALRFGPITVLWDLGGSLTSPWNRSTMSPMATSDWSCSSTAPPTTAPSTRVPLRPWSRRCQWPSSK